MICCFSDQVSSMRDAEMERGKTKLKKKEPTTANMSREIPNKKVRQRRMFPAGWSLADQTAVAVRNSKRNLNQTPAVTQRKGNGSCPISKKTAIIKNFYIGQQSLQSPRIGLLLKGGEMVVVGYHS